MGRGDLVDKQDARWLRTEAAIMAAFEHELAQSPVASMRVARLAEKASVSKAAFYLHYAGIDDLADAYVLQKARELVKELGDVRCLLVKPEAFTKRFLHTMGAPEQVRLMEKLAANSLQGMFMDRLFDELRAEFKRQVGGPYHIPGQIESSAIAFILNGLLGVIWVNGGCPSQTIVHQAALTVKQIVTSPRAGAAEMAAG